MGIELTDDDYEYRMDKIFGKGEMWKHRTLRTFFDKGSSEWDKTTMDEKLKYLKIIIEKEKEDGREFSWLLDDYKARYREQNKLHVIDSLNETLADLFSILSQYSILTTQY